MDYEHLIFKNVRIEAAEENVQVYEISFPQKVRVGRFFNKPETKH